MSDQIARLSKLPRLLYVGDVAVESSVGGMALLHRLLQGYPVERLYIVESNLTRSCPQRRLAEVKYGELCVGKPSLFHTRLNPLYSALLYLTASARAKKLHPLIRRFKPEAVLTVAHGFSWLTAAALARSFQLPLHLIIHDDWL